MITAINIKTDLWNRIISLLMNNNWTVTYKYNDFDAGIDFDLIILGKEGEEILLGWDNWMEGEIQCSESVMRKIEQLADCIFEKGEPVNLKPEVVGLYRK